MKKTILAVTGASLTIIGAFATETNLVKNGDFESGKENWALSNSTISTNGAKNGSKYLLLGGKSSSAASKELIPVDPKADYILSVWVKKGKEPAYIGFSCFDKNKKLIKAANVDYISGTHTTLTDPCKIGDKVLKVSSTKGWKPGYWALVAFNADDSGKYNDLPNRELSEYSIEKVEKTGNGGLIKLKKPLKKAYPKGTKIREHIYSAMFSAFTPIVSREALAEYTELEAEMQGRGVHPNIHGARKACKWRAGTAFVQIFITSRAKEGNKMCIDNVKLTKEE